MRLVLSRGCSTDILGKSDKSPNYSQKFLRFLNKLVKISPAVSLLVHFAKGQIHLEKVIAKNKQKTSFDAFKQLFPDLDEDIRYVIQA